LKGKLVEIHFRHFYKAFFPAIILLSLNDLLYVKILFLKGKKLTMGVSTVETNRDRDRDCPSCRDQFLKPVEIDFYFISVEIFKIETFQSRLCRVEIFVEIVETHRDCRDLSRRSRDAVEICRDAVEICREISTRKYKIHALLDRDRDKLSRNAKIFRSRRIFRSRSRLFGLDIDVETKSRNLDLDRDFSIVETNF
jgi:hypothetical protein